jgi:GT2 family glycosyltransferase
MDAPLDLSVSIVTHNSQDHLAALFASLSEQEGVSWELFLVDNASTDQTGCMLSRCEIGQVTLNRENIGYGRAHNQNRAHFRGRHLLFLNPDVVLAPGLFRALVKVLDENPAIAIAGPMVLEGPERTPFPPRRFYPGEALLPLEPGLHRKEIAWLSGCCLAIRRTVFDALAGFDADYFLYYEDTDLCWRARRAGWRIGWLQQYEVLHHGCGSQAGISEYEQARTLFAAAIRFWEKRHSPRDLPSLLLFQVWSAQALLLTSKLHVNPWRYRRWCNRDRLRARRDICREWLRRHRYRQFALDFRWWRMVARQLRLLAEWLRRGGDLPLDDY